MAWYERQYNQETYRPGGDGGGAFARLGSHSVVTWLLAINAIVFVLDFILSEGVRSPFSPRAWGYFSIETAFGSFQIWRLLTYQFFHVDFWHILFNMIGLFFFGPMIEQWWGSRRFLAFYLLCGATGAVVMTLLAFIPGLLGITAATPLVGASGAIFGILVAAATLYPHQRVMLIFPPIPMSMRTMALVFLGIAALTIIVGSPNAGGQAAHLGGAAMGYLLVKWPGTLGWADNANISHWQQKRKHARVHKQQQSRLAEEQEVDRILDKVRDHGLHSLTRREKRTLNQATERKRRSS